LSRSTDLSIAPIHRIIKRAGASRVSEDAADALRTVLQKVGVHVGREALGLAQHAGRRTIKKEDIDKAAEPFLRLIA